MVRRPIRSVSTSELAAAVRYPHLEAPPVPAFIREVMLVLCSTSMYPTIATLTPVQPCGLPPTEVKSSFLQIAIYHLKMLVFYEIA